MNSRTLFFAALSFGLVFAAAPVFAEDDLDEESQEVEEVEEPEPQPEVVEEEEVDEFARHLSFQSAVEMEIGLRLYQEGDDYRAITSLKRYRLLSASPDADYLSHLIIGDIYRRNEYPSLALRHFWDASRAGVELDQSRALQAYHLGLQEICVSMRAYPNCHPMLRDLEEGFEEIDHVEGAELARYHRRFVEFVLRAPPSLDEDFSDPALQRAARELHDRHQVFDDLPLRRPALAGILSAIIPGAGQAYNGRWLDAALALGFTGLFAGATAYSYLGLDSIPLTVTSGIFALGFYSGNITNAIVDARRHNASVYDDFFEGLHEDLWPRHRFFVDDGEVHYDYRFDWPGRVEPTPEDVEPPPIPGML